MRTHVPSLVFSLLVATSIVTPRLAAAETAAATSPAAAKEAGEIYRTRCALCHGASGKGDGAAAAGLTPKPRDYSDPAWQASVSDEQIEKIILQGGTAVGKSAMMPASPDLASSPTT
jgi:mono/diheme cytochrome c family protein